MKRQKRQAELVKNVYTLPYILLLLLLSRVSSGRRWIEISGSDGDRLTAQDRLPPSRPRVG